MWLWMDRIKMIKITNVEKIMVSENNFKIMKVKNRESEND